MNESAPQTCRHCERRIVTEDGRWVDPEATGDDSVWRETCDANDTFTAEHEPATPAEPEPAQKPVAEITNPACPCWSGFHFMHRPRCGCPTCEA